MEQSLRRFGETHFANAARAVVSQYPSNRQIGFLAIIAILRGKIAFRQGSEASTPQQLARLIDQNWQQSKTLLYNGLIALWLEYTKHPQLATAAKAIINHNPSEQDIGLEELVQKLDPQIGKPKLEVSHSRIDFDSIDTESQRTIDIQITNRGRGFLYGKVQLATNMSGLQISETEIRGEGSVSVKLDASYLSANKTYQTDLVFSTNGGMVRVPISCDIIQEPTRVVRDVKVNNRVEQKINYFEVLGLSIDDLQGKDEVAIRRIVNDAHRKLYARTVGAYANVPRPDGRTPWQWQVILNHARDTLLDLQTRRAHITEITQQPELTEIEGVPDVNTKDKDGNTPLHLAASDNDYRGVEVLIKSGADIKAKNKHGNTPLHLAVKKNADKVVEVLLRHGADINAKDNEGETPLHLVAYLNTQKTMAELLLRHGADVNAKSYTGMTPLHLAALVSKYKGAYEVAGVLLRHGADVNAKNHIEKTPLHLAVRLNTQKTMVELLLRHGADVNVKNENRQTPLYRAVHSDAYEVAEVLLRHGADVNTKEYRGKTPLHRAKENKNTDMIMLLRKHGGRGR